MVRGQDVRFDWSVEEKKNDKIHMKAGLRVHRCYYITV